MSKSPRRRMATAILNDLATLAKTTHRIVDGLGAFLGEEATFVRVIASAANLSQRHALFADACKSRSPLDAAKRLLGPVADLEPDAIFILRDKHEKELMKAVGNLNLVLEALRSVQIKTAEHCLEVETKVRKAQQYLQAQKQQTSSGQNQAILSIEAALEKRTDGQPFSAPMLASLAFRCREAMELDLEHKATVAAAVKTLVCEQYLRASNSGAAKDGGERLHALIRGLEANLAKGCSAALSASSSIGATQEAVSHCGIDGELAKREFFEPLARYSRERHAKDSGKEEGRGPSSKAESHEEAELSSALASLSLGGPTTGNKDRAPLSLSPLPRTPPAAAQPLPLSITIADEGAYSVLTFVAGGDSTSSNTEVKGSDGSEKMQAGGEAEEDDLASLFALFSLWREISSEILLFSGGTRTVIPGVEGETGGSVSGKAAAAVGGVGGGGAGSNSRTPKK